MSVNLAALQYLIAYFFRVDRHAASGGGAKRPELVDGLDELPLFLFFSLRPPGREDAVPESIEYFQHACTRVGCG